MPSPAAANGTAADSLAADAEGKADSTANGRQREEEEDGERTLEEIQEMHLRDSFWSVS